MTLLTALTVATACMRDGDRAKPPARTGANAPALLPPAQRADRIEIDKSERRMRLLREGKTIGSYRIVLGDAPGGHKHRRGDERTPEGEYRISERNPNSAFLLSLRVSYPNEHDRRRARERGVLRRRHHDSRRHFALVARRLDRRLRRGQRCGDPGNLESRARGHADPNRSLSATRSPTKHDRVAFVHRAYRGGAALYARR